MNRLLLFIAWLYSSAAMAGGDNRFPVSEIPAELKENAHAVVRMLDETYEIIDIDEAVYRSKFAVTIFSEQGDNLAYVYEFYDKLSRVRDFSAWVYDAQGREIARLKKGDIIDRSNVSGFSLYEDDRVKLADMSQKRYPYTVYSEIEKSYDYLYQIPRFSPVPGENIAVQDATYTLIAPDQIFPRYKQVNIELDPEESRIGDKKVLRWEIENIPVLETESFGLAWNEKAPMILVAPTKFSFDGYDGDMSTWNSFGEWIQSLNEDRNTLPESTKNKLREMTEGMSRREKVMAIYDYMQDRTRYVSIQLGIGGYQPFESGLVDEVGYGDCKALTYYTQSMLEAVGIPSNYTLIFAGSGHIPLYEDFPSATFNHVILAVPMESDTIWLECTSQTSPNGFLGSFTHDRKALMITENGAEVVTTPVYSHEVNYEQRNGLVKLNEDGSAHAEVSTKYAGIMYEYGGLSGVLHLGSEEQKNWIHRVTRIPHYELKNFSMANHEGEIPFAEVHLELLLPKYSSTGGQRIFFTPNLMNTFSNPLPKENDRQEPVRIRTGFADSDSIVYEFPSHLRPEFLPEPAAMSNQFGEYRTHYEFIQGRLIYRREFTLYKGEYQPADYQDLFDFFNEVAREDRRKVVMLGGT